MWMTPKTDWTEKDVVLCSDYNRIKGNLIFLKELAVILYPPFDLAEMGMDKKEDDYPYADEINRLADNLERLSMGSYHMDVGEKIVYRDNGPFIAYEDLNRIERATLDMYKNLCGQREGRRTLTFMLGQREVL